MERRSSNKSLREVIDMNLKLTHNLVSQSVSQSVSQGDDTVADSLLSRMAVTI